MTELAAQTALATKLCPWLDAPLEHCADALASGRLGHAWLIHGVAGIGKLNLAFVLARRLLTGAAAPLPLAPAELSAAMSGRREAQNHHPDLHYVFPEEDKAAIGIEQIRAVTEALTLKSFAGAAKVVIIEPAEALTSAAANALLKTLEQPSPQSYLLLVSHCPGRLPATIRSRCQRLAVRAPGAAALESWAGLAPGAAAGRDAAATPLELARALAAGAEALDETYARELAEIVAGMADPIAIADAWAKRDVDHALQWLVRRLQRTIRSRSVARGSTLITETPSPRLHTELAEGLSLRSAFAQLDKAEALRNQLGGGINVPLALRVLLLAFRPEREAT